MTIRAQIVQQALSLVGTPWHHRAMVPGAGIDCVRLLEWVAKHVGLLPHAWEPPVYSQQWHLHNNEQLLLGVLADVGCVPVPFDARQPGDALTFQYGRVASHMAILVRRNPDYIVHAALDVGRVIHQGLSDHLCARLRGVYTFPGVEGTA